MWLQILVSLFVIIILFKLFKQRQANKLAWSNFFAWLILWLIVLVVFWQPATASYLANFLGIGRGADLIIYLSVILIFYLIFKIFIRLDKTDKQITKLVREEAIKNVQKR